MLKLESHRENGPARRAEAHTQQRAGSGGLARPQQLTFEFVVGAPPLARLVEVLEELRQPAACTRARQTRLWP